MSSKIPFEFDISVSADKKRRAKNKGSGGAFEGSSHKCDVVGCDPLAGATIYHANARFRLFMYELAAFLPMLFLNVMVVSMC